MIMGILGPNLMQLFEFCDKKFSIATICNIFHQILSRLEVMHSHNFVHRDMKPENICIGQGKKSNIVYLIDFGLCKRYLDPKTGEHITYRNDKGIVGTIKYLSLETHLGAEHGRRDDLEALCNIIIYFFNMGTLPWDIPKPKMHTIDMKDPKAYQQQLV
jgi:serine/threonine protein kinase